MRLSRQLSFKKVLNKKKEEKPSSTPIVPLSSATHNQSPLSRYSSVELSLSPQNLENVAKFIINDDRILSTLQKRIKSLDELGEVASAISRISSKLGLKSQLYEMLVSMEFESMKNDDLNELFFHESLLTMCVDHIFTHPKFSSTKELILLPITPLIFDENSISFEVDPTEIASDSKEALAETIENNISNLIHYAHLFIVGICDKGSSFQLPFEVYVIAKYLDENLRLSPNVVNNPSTHELIAKLLISRLISPTNIDSHEFLNNALLTPNKRRNLNILREILENIASQRLYNENAGHKIVLNNFMKSQMSRLSEFLSSIILEENPIFNSTNDIDYDESYNFQMDIKKINDIILENEDAFLETFSCNSNTFRHLLSHGKYPEIESPVSSILEDQLQNGVSDNYVDEKNITTDIKNSSGKTTSQSNVPAKKDGLFIEVYIEGKKYSGYVFSQDIIDNTQPKSDSAVHQSKVHTEPDLEMNQEPGSDEAARRKNSIPQSFGSENETFPTAKVSLLDEIHGSFQEKNILPEVQESNKAQLRELETTRVEISTTPISSENFEPKKSDRRLPSVLLALEKLALLEPGNEIDKIVSAGGTEKVLRVAEKYSSSNEELEIDKAISRALFHLCLNSKDACEIVTASKFGIEVMIRFLSDSPFIELSDALTGFRVLIILTEYEIGLAKIRGGGLGLNLLFSGFKRQLLQILSSMDLFDRSKTEDLLISFFKLHFLVEKTPTDSLVPLHLLVSIIQQCIDDSNLQLATCCIRVLHLICLGSEESNICAHPEYLKTQYTVKVVYESFYKLASLSSQVKGELLFHLIEILSLILKNDSVTLDKVKLVYVIYSHINTYFPIAGHNDQNSSDLGASIVEKLCELLESLTHSQRPELLHELLRGYKVLLTGLEKSTNSRQKKHLINVLHIAVSNSSKEFESAFIENGSLNNILTQFDEAVHGDLFDTDIRFYISALLDLQITILSRFKSHEKNIKKQLKSSQNVLRIRSLKQCYEDVSVISKARILAGRIGIKF